jgi:hypothetical protein
MSVSKYQNARCHMLDGCNPHMYRRGNLKACGQRAEMNVMLITKDEPEEGCKIQVVVYFKVRNESSVDLLSSLWSAWPRIHFRQEQMIFLSSTESRQAHTASYPM